jgi:D-alanyl-D-alanine carboxypeptidase
MIYRRNLKKGSAKKRSSKKKIYFWNKINRTELTLIIVTILIAIFGFTFLKPALSDYLYYQMVDVQGSLTRNHNLIESLLQAYRPIRNWSVSFPSEITARSVAAIEILPGEPNRHLLIKNSDHPYPIASITKLMTAMVAVDQYDLDHQILASSRAANQIGNIPLIKEGDQLSVRDLIYLSLMESNNSAAYALAEIKGVSDFVQRMNDKAASLNLTQTRFYTPTGLTGINRVDNYSTASEITEMVAHLWQQPKYEIIRQALGTDDYAIYDGTGAFYYRAVNNNQLLGEYNNLVGSKTGYLPSAGECLVSVFQKPTEENYLIVVVLGSDHRFEDTKRVVEWIPEAYLYSFNYGL